MHFFIRPFHSPDEQRLITESYLRFKAIPRTPIDSESKQQEYSSAVMPYVKIWAREACAMVEVTGDEDMEPRNGDWRAYVAQGVEDVDEAVDTLQETIAQSYGDVSRAFLAAMKRQAPESLCTRFCHEGRPLDDIWRAPDERLAVMAVLFEETFAYDYDFAADFREFFTAEYFEDFVKTYTVDAWQDWIIDIVVNGLLRQFWGFIDQGILCDQRATLQRLLEENSALPHQLGNDAILRLI